MYSFDYNTDLHLSHIPSAIQSFQLGAGYPTLVPTWTRSFPMPTKQTTHTLLNEGRKKAWKEDGPTRGQCLWEMHGVWGWCKTRNQAVVLRENYFVKHPVSGKKVCIQVCHPLSVLMSSQIEWYTDCYYPFMKKWAERVLHASTLDKILFVEAIPNEVRMARPLCLWSSFFQFCPTSWTEECQIPNMVYAPHWYDLDSLFNKKYGEFTVNVQGLSRVICLLQSIFCLHLILLSRECFLSRLFTGVTKALVITSVFKYVPWLKKHTSHWERSQSCLASAVFPWTWSTCSSRVSSFRLTRYPPTVREKLLSLRILSGKSAWWMRWLLA